LDLLGEGFKFGVRGLAFGVIGWEFGVGVGVWGLALLVEGYGLWVVSIVLAGLIKQKVLLMAKPFYWVF
jgi:hypothetical protein